MQVPRTSKLPEAYDNFVVNWEQSVTNDLAIHMLVLIQQGYTLSDVYASSQVLIIDLLMLISIPQSIYLKAKYQSRERTVFYITYNAASQLNIDRSFFAKGPPSEAIKKSDEQTMLLNNFHKSKTVSTEAIKHV